ncbi:MAG: DUF5681 domain-containing protein, partial [Pseudomonadota bacterium]
GFGWAVSARQSQSNPTSSREHLPMVNKTRDSSGRDQAGRFKKGVSGNPEGPPKGTRHRVTKAVEALLEGQAEALTQTAIEAALNGDTTAMRLCLERIAPPRKDAPVAFELPRMRTASDAATAAGAVLDAVAAGELTPTEGAHVMALVETFRRTLETTDIENRLTALEEKT